MAKLTAAKKRDIENAPTEMQRRREMSIQDAAKLARYDDLANTVEELHDECMVLRKAIRQTLDENGHLADGEVCTLLPLKLALRKVGTPWAGDELHNAELRGRRLADGPA